jgi:hypothetical protein
MDCPICLDPIESNVNCMTTECGHCFHASCILKHVSMTKGGCPMCRAVMVENVEMGEDDDDEEDLESDDESTYISEDFRNDESVQEDHMLRGVRWLFQQHDESEPSTSMFDDNSMEMTPNSVRRWRSPLNEDSIDELYEEDMEMNWQDMVEESRKKQKEISDLEQFLKEKRNVSYNDLLTTVLSMMYREKFDYLEMTKCYTKIENILTKKIEDTDNGPMQIDELM